MAETAQSVGQILDDPDFRALPQERRDAIMRDLLEQGAPPPAAPGIAGRVRQFFAPPAPEQVGATTDVAQWLPGFELLNVLPRQTQEQVVAATPQTARALPATAINVAGSGLGAALGIASGIPGLPLVLEAAGSYGARKLNVALGLEDPDPLQDVLSVVIPAATRGPSTLRETVLKPIAKSSVIGQKALQNVEKKAHDVTRSARQVDIDAVKAQNQALETAHAQAKLMVQQQNQLYDQLNRDAQALFDNLTAGERANYVQLKTAAERTNKAYTHRESRIETFARGQKAAAPQQVQAAFDSMPAIPNKADVQKLYQDIDATLATIDMKVPVQKYREAQAKIKTWTDGLENFPRGERETRRMEGFLKGLQITPEGAATGEALSLTAIHNGTKFMGRQVRQLRRAARRGVPGAEQELAAANKLYIALDESFAEAAQHHTIPGQIRMQALEARAAWKRVQTWEDMKEFGQDMTRLDASTGNQVLTPIQARQRLESPQYASLKRFLQQTPVDPANPAAGNMYDFTVETFKALEPKQMTIKDRVAYLAQLQAVGDPQGRLVDTSPIDTSQFRPPERTFTPPVPQSQFVPEPGAPALLPEPEALPAFQGQEIRPGALSYGTRFLLPATGAVAGWGAKALGINPYLGAGLGAASGEWASHKIAEYFMTAQGQKTLLRIMQERGLRLDPVTMGLLNAGTRHGITYTLPADDDDDD